MKLTHEQINELQRLEQEIGITLSGGQLARIAKKRFGVLITRQAVSRRLTPSYSTTSNEKQFSLFPN